MSIADDPGADRGQKARSAAASAVRDLCHALVAHDASDEVLVQVAGAADEATRELRRGPRRRRAVLDFSELTSGASGTAPKAHPMADRAVAGPVNPTSVEITVGAEGEEAVAQVWFGPAFEGAPGRVHGGMVAAVFDDVTGFVLAFVGEPAFTGELAIRYRAPVPVETPIEFRARLRQREGRRLVVEAEACLDGTVLATAEAVFVVVDQDHFATQARELLDRA
jgi:acyl-coenzyme A thioesterase PaaI-like protein